MELIPFGVDRIDDLVGLLLRCAPHEDLTPDEVLTACHEQPGIVMGTPDGESVLAVGVGREIDGSLTASIRLLAVGPNAQRSGNGKALLAHAEQWAWERGAARIVIGGSLPFSLWPGIAEESPADFLAQACGYAVETEWDSYALPVTYRAEPPAGVVIRRAVHDSDVTQVHLASAAKWSRQSDEIARALEHGTCHVAVAQIDGEEEVVGLGCHSVTRAGWAGPLVIDQRWTRQGVGSALLGQMCRDLMIAEFTELTIPETSDVRMQSFCAAVEAKPTIRYRRMVKTITHG